MSLDKYDRPALEFILPSIMEKWLLQNGFSFKTMYGKNGKVFIRSPDNNDWRKACVVVLPISKDLGDYVARMSELVADIAEAQDRQANKVLDQLIASLSFLEREES